VSLFIRVGKREYGGDRVLLKKGIPTVRFKAKEYQYVGGWVEAITFC